MNSSPDRFQLHVGKN